MTFQPFGHPGGGERTKSLPRMPQVNGTTKMDVPGLKVTGTLGLAKLLDGNGVGEHASLGLTEHLARFVLPCRDGVLEPLTFMMFQDFSAPCHAMRLFMVWTESTSSALPRSPEASSARTTPSPASVDRGEEHRRSGFHGHDFPAARRVEGKGSGYRRMVTKSTSGEDR